MTTGDAASGWRARLWGRVTENLIRYGGLRPAAEPVTPALLDGPTVPRALSEYIVRYLYFQNKKLYKKLTEVGAAKHPYPARFNPVPSVVAFYTEHTLSGNMAAQPLERPGADEGTKARDAALMAAVGQVHEWSNWPVFRDELTEDAAVFSDFWIKAATRLTDGEATGVYLQLLPASSVRRCEVDERGYVRGIRIDTPRMESLFDGPTREHTLVEVWDGSGVAYYEAEGQYNAPEEDEQLPPRVGALSFDELGYDFIPVVWGRAATYWWDATDQIDEINHSAWLMRKLNKPTLMVSANAMDERGFPMPAPDVVPGAGVDGGRRPSTYEELGGRDGDGVATVVRLPGQATAAWSGAPVDFAVMGQDITDMRAHVEGSLPEYIIAAQVQAVNLAADTLRMIQEHAGDRVRKMRDTLERAIVRATMMALTLGQLAVLDGFSPAEIGMYDKGDFGHRFAERPVFARARLEMAQEAGQHVNNTAGIGAAYRLAGYNEAEVDMVMQGDEPTGVEQ